MPHLHFSPFQFANAEQLAESPKQVKAERAFAKKRIAERERKTHDMGSTMPCHDAQLISGSPNAFISPNSPDAMRQAKAVFGME